MARMSRAERNAWAEDSRDHADTTAANAGHTLTWTEMVGGWSGDCGDCGANVTAFAGGTSAHSTRDARSATCQPGTLILTEIEDGRFGELVDQAVSQYGASLDGYGDEASL